MSITDLTLRPPRSPRARLGGFAILPRMLDKGRAVIAETNGEYKYNCPLDQRFTNFAGIDAEAMKGLLAEGKGDGDILKWITETSTTKPTEWEIQAWSLWVAQRVPEDIESREFFNEMQTKMAPQREDIVTWFDMLDLDDYVSFGGKP
jgi:hypothetical protein